MSQSTHNTPATNCTGQESSLAARLDGQTGINAIVGALYFNILQDNRIAHFFNEVAVDQVIAHQRLFLGAALGANTQYSGRDLTTAHAALVREQGLNTTHFDALLENLQVTLIDLKLDADLRNEVIAKLRGLRTQVFGGEVPAKD